MLQNLPSIICGHVLNPQPNEIVLDMCAAPGNKTTHLAQLMNDTGCVIALDKTPAKWRTLMRTIELFGLKTVHCFDYDSTKVVSDAVGADINTELSFKPPFPSESFDKILLDAPCSCLGMRPMLRNDLTVKMVSSYAVVQRKLFASAVQLLRVGGVLVYSTCTIMVAENEDIVRWALQKYPQLKLVAAEPLLGGPGWPNEGLSDDQR